jgi:hypothetical protein
LTAVLYLKQIEGLARDGAPIRPKSVSSRIHELTRIPRYEDEGHIRTDYADVEDWGLMHVVFEDGSPTCFPPRSFSYRSIEGGETPLSYSALGYDTVDVIYSAYLSAERGGAEVAVGE